MNKDNKLKLTLGQKRMNEENYLDYSWELDGHFNAKGDALLSQIIAQEIEKNYPNFIVNCDRS